MASQVAHIIYAQKYFEKNPAPAKYREEFFLGATFPDIRRIDDSIRRKDTHNSLGNINLDFERLSPFEAGWKFHLFCDMRRNEIMLEKKDSFFDSKDLLVWNEAGKILEDKIIYPEFSNWEKLVNYFNNPPFQESGLFVTPETFKFWYAILAKYFEKRSDEKSIRAFMSKQDRDKDSIDKIIEKITTLEKSKKFLEILESIKEEIV